MFTYHVTFQAEVTVEANDEDNAISEAIDRLADEDYLDWQVEAVSSNDPRH